MRSRTLPAAGGADTTAEAAQSEVMAPWEGRVMASGMLGERIAAYRRRRGLSQAALAGLVGRSESWLSQVERGVRSVDRLSVLLDMARVLHVDVESLSGRPWQYAPNAFSDPDTSGPRLVIFIFTVIAVAAYTVVVWSMYRSMVKNFDMTIRRQSR